MLALLMTVLVGATTESALAQSSQPPQTTPDGLVIADTVPTTAPPTTVAPTTVAPTTAAPTTTEAPTTTVAPTTAVSTTAVPTTKKAPVTTKRKATPTTVPRKAPTGGTSIEIDISQQRLYLYRGGKLYRTLPVSTGSGRRYCENGSCGTAHTPRGHFRVGRRITGWRTSALGRLYNPLYFSGGYAIHGGRLPGYPASHGCVRISMSAARWFPSAVPTGTPVWIHN